MSAIVPRGRCPSLYAPMQSGDGLLVRVKPPGGRLTPAQTRALADAATRYGNGIVELGNRASLQLRGFTSQAIAPFAAEMVAVGLACADPAAEARRTVISPPLAGHDPAASPLGAAVARALEMRLAEAADLARLPGKFGCLADAGGVLPLGGVAADVVLRIAGSACFAAPDGGTLAARCASEDAPETAVALLRAFLALAPTVAPMPRRMRQLVAAVGAQAVLAAAGLTGEPVAPLPRPAATAGWLAYGDGHGAVLAGLPFGATTAAALTSLADLAGDLHVTPFRAFAIPTVKSPAPLLAALEDLGFIAAPNDPRGRIAACPGAPACTSASTAARADAAELAKLGFAGTLHVSGCAKGCAHPAAADITLTAGAGGYALIRHGRAGDPASHHGLSLTQAAALIRQFESAAA